MAQILARSTILYLGAVNAGSAGLFAYDKMQAGRGGWRVPERQLCTSALAGGWAGGLLAMQVCRHKTRKQSFQRKYVKAISTNALVFVPALILLVQMPGYRLHFVNALKGIWGESAKRGRGKRNPPRNRR